MSALTIVHHLLQKRILSFMQQAFHRKNGNYIWVNYFSVIERCIRIQQSAPKNHKIDRSNQTHESKTILIISIKGCPRSMKRFFYQYRATLVHEPSYYSQYLIWIIFWIQGMFLRLQRVFDQLPDFSCLGKIFLCLDRCFWF